jgi:hypothetical protein
MKSNELNLITPLGLGVGVNPEGEDGADAGEEDGPRATGPVNTHQNCYKYYLNWKIIWSETNSFIKIC